MYIQVGTLELWSVATCTQLDSIEAPHSDVFTCLSIADHESTIVLGTSKGSLRTVLLVDSSGQPATDNRSVQCLSLSPTYGVLIMQ